MAIMNVINEQILADDYFHDTKALWLSLKMSENCVNSMSLRLYNVFSLTTNTWLCAKTTASQQQ